MSLSSLIMFSCIPVVLAWTFPETGWATMTHYDLPLGYLASCGCTGRSTYYPTVALSTLGFGTEGAYGPSCGRCFKLTLIQPFYANPPFYPEETKSIVVKVTDRCPGDSLCGATEDHPNYLGAWLNFDLAYPSRAIPKDFFPSNEKLYGFKDFGVWNITYEAITCAEWNGWNDQAALGSAPNMFPGVCCPAEPSANNTCPIGGLPPDTTTNTALGRDKMRGNILYGLFLPLVVLLW